MGRFLIRLALSGLLAFLVCLPGCAAFPPGLKVAVGFTGSPLGVEVRVEQAATLTPGTPATWVAEPGDILTPATAPAPAPELPTINPNR